MAFGILQRYVMAEVLRAFVLALLTMTIILVLFMVMAEAVKFGLSPRDILTFVPFVIPGTLPYTVPVSILFAVTVVYGRLAGDNEITAVKSAGRSAFTVLWPAIALGGALTGLLLHLSADAIPRANDNAKLAIFKNLEDMFYKFLKKDLEFNNPGWPFLIKVRDVDLDAKVMDTAIFKHRKRGEANPNAFGAIITAQKARVNFDLKAGVARVYLEKAEISNNTVNDDIELVNKTYFDFPLSNKLTTGDEKKVQQWTTAEMIAEQAHLRVRIGRERKRQAMEAALWMASGRIERVDWRQVQAAFVDHGYWTRRLCEFETEKQFRVAQSFGSLIFVLLGAPVGIRFARRDYLSAFISCFMPIIVLYYPLMLLGSNLGREDVVDPTYALWAGNVVLVVLAFSVLRPIHRH